MTTEKGGRPSSADDDRIALRRAEAVKLRARGKTFQEIANALSIGLATAHLDVRTAMTEIAKDAEENAQTERGTQLARLERALLVVESVLANAPNAENGEELQLKALDRLLKIQDHGAKLLGLYAPEKRELNAKVAAVGLDELDAMRDAAKSNECPTEPEASEPSGQSS